MTTQSTLIPLESGVRTDEAARRIRELKTSLGSQLLILGHHYQVDEVIEFADHTGDSFKLAKQASEARDARFVVFCGVHFMAESADMLSESEVAVVLPDLAAGCSMADMANADQVETCWEILTDGGKRDDLVPITYMNSSAAIKAFCGRNGGVVCTSSNAQAVITWGFEQGRRLLFLPDQHLGRNISHELGVPLNDMAVWDPHALPDTNMDQGCGDARVVLWKGHCSVHTKFLPEHVDQVREAMPDVQVIAHPECPFEVVQKADAHGSTEKIIQAVSNSPAGSRWAVGTEINLVSRLAKQNPDKTVVSLSGINCLCSTMYRIDLPHLLWVLENLREGHVVNQISVDPVTRQDALLALDRMLALP